MCDNLFDRYVGMLLKIEWDSKSKNSKLQLWRKALANCMRIRVKASLTDRQMKMAEKSWQAICVEEQVDDPLVVAEAAHVRKSPARW
ncbi:hypothetical protein ACLB2K_060523 [Fragaria x ananassa]